MSKVKSTSDKIKEISAKFDIAETLVSDDITDTIDTEVTEILDKKEFYNPIDIVNVQTMADDFKYSRETLKESINYGRMVLEHATQELLKSDGKSKANNTMAFAELTTAVLNGVKVHSQLYKDFSIVLVNMKKVLEGDDPKTVNNTVNITESISTVDLIAQLKATKN